MNGTANSQHSVSVQVRGLRKSYHGVEVLHGISLDVARGEIFVIMGPPPQSPPAGRVPGTILCD